MRVKGCNSAAEWCDLLDTSYIEICYPFGVESSKGKLVGVVWFTDLEDGCARIHFSGVIDDELPALLTAICVYIDATCAIHCINELQGVIPVDNALGLRMAKRLGFKAFMYSDEMLYTHKTFEV